jgi:hypothetical protein
MATLSGWWRPRLVMALLAGLFVPFLPAAAEPADGEPADPAFERALAHYARSEWVQAFDELARMADAGHCEAARIALLMRAHGPRLFGETFVVALQRRARWIDAATPCANRS